jgi:small subunit ribosomal protein S17
MKVFTGKVTSTKMARTATVSVTRVVAHPVYKKRVRRVKKYQVHDNFNVKVGQKVRFIECRPYSKSKRWKIIEVIEADRKDKKKGVTQKSIRKVRKNT